VQFTISAIRQCAGGNHVEIDVSVGGGPTKTHSILRSDLIGQDENFSVRERIINRMISAVLEATTGQPTNAQIVNALVNKTFEV